jgi:hypothetical protein
VCNEAERVLRAFLVLSFTGRGFRGTLPLERPDGGHTGGVRKVGALLEKAERSFAAADLLLDAGDADFAAARAYYGYF